MIDGLVTFLYSRSIIRRHYERIIHNILEESSWSPEESYGYNSFGFRHIYGTDDIFWVSTRGYPDENISFLSESLNLSSENFIETIIIPYCREYWGVGRESDSRECHPLGLVPPDKLGSPVLCIGSTSSVPCDEDFSSVFERVNNNINNLLEVSLMILIKSIFTWAASEK